MLNRILPILVFAFRSSSLVCQVNSWQPDADGNHEIGTNDLIFFLSVFGQADVDEDGVWDNSDDCIEDICGVCEGDGPSVLLWNYIESIDSIYNSESEDWDYLSVLDSTMTWVCEVLGCMDENAANFNENATVDSGDCAFGPCSGMTYWSYFGENYSLVEIDTLCWFAENLRSVQYANGDSILTISSSTNWFEASEGVACFYGEGSYESDCAPNCDSLINVQSLGMLYNRSVVLDSRKTCPIGWRVPSDDDWRSLEIYLGMDLLQSYSLGARGAGIGTLLKSENLWNGVDSLGLDVYPVGRFSAYANGYSYYSSNTSATLWTSSHYDDANLFNRIFDVGPYIIRSLLGENKWCSLRCVK